MVPGDASIGCPELARMLSTFGDDAEAEHYSAVTPDEMPPSFRRLLVHDHHMTVTLEGHRFGAEAPASPRRVSVGVIEARLVGDLYSRKITLMIDAALPPVLAGLVRFDLATCSPEMRAAVVEGRTPLGHLLIRHHRMRTIEPGPYWRVDTRGGIFGLRFNCPPIVYGRLATIHCDGVAALRLLEVLTRV